MNQKSAARSIYRLSSIILVLSLLFSNMNVAKASVILAREPGTTPPLSTGSPVYHVKNGVIFLKNSNDTGIADIARNDGVPGNQPVMGDWKNDGIDTIGIYLRSENTNGFAAIGFAPGNPGDVPIASNWDGLP